MMTHIQIRRMQLLLVLIVHETSADGFPPSNNVSQSGTMLAVMCCTPDELRLLRYAQT